jgi:hypothetical protein
MFKYLADVTINQELIQTVFIIHHHHHHQPINVPTAGAQAFLMDYPTRRKGHNPPRGPNADWWVLTTAIAAGTNGLTWLPKH